MRLIFGILVLALSLNCFAKGTVVTMSTTKGDVEITLYDEKAPISVKNFLKYVENKKYDGTIFHRVISSFMIQGGGFNPKMEKIPSYAPIKNEADNGLRNEEGTVAMARTQNVHSATNQFFINVKDNSFLNHTSKDQRGYGYAVFGTVTKGMSVINRIKKVKTGSNGAYQDVPVEPIIIKSIKIKK